MPEELAKAAGQAAGTLSQTTWGALLILSWVVFGVVVWSLRRDIKDERASHQETRDEYVTVLKGKDQIAAGLLALSDGQKVIAESQQRQTGLLIDALANLRRAG